MFAICAQPIERESAYRQLTNAKAGGVVVFEGWVRDHNDGKHVTSLEYQVYRELAQKEGERILAEARERFDIFSIVGLHREGHLKIGDIAVWVAASAPHRDAAFRATRYVIDQIKRRLPIWKKEHYVNQTPAWVSCHEHHAHLHLSEDQFYQKQARVVEQDSLRRARVVVVGAGGLGCPALTALAAAGVGHITIVDFDRVEVTNLHRQTLYSTHAVGERKALVARQKLREMNPFICVEAQVDFAHAGNVAALLAEHDLVLDCTDNMKTKFLLHDACFITKKAMISASVFQYQGQLRTFVPSQAADFGCWRCTLEQTPDDALVGNCNDFGTVAPVLGALGSLQASEALQYLQHQTNSTLKETLLIDLQSLASLRVRNTARAGCPSCRGVLALERDACEIATTDLTGEFELVDIRQKDDAILNHYLHSTKKIAVVCQRGIRSLRLVKALRKAGAHHFYSVQGGAAILDGAATINSRGELAIHSPHEGQRPTPDMRSCH